MNNSNLFDSFEAIAQDAVALLTAIVADLVKSDDMDDVFASMFIGKAAEEFCLRAIALGGE